jgi:hypothetical protein
VTWVEVFMVLVVSHLVGDFGFQTDWQARHKRGGLGRNGVARRALAAHVLTYTLAFVPAFVWLWSEVDALVLALAAVLAATHALQDDGRLLDAYMRIVKRADPERHPTVTVAVDQTMHVLVLFGLALIAVA